MGRGRGKGKKQSANAIVAARNDDVINLDDEKLPSRRRGRPQKPIKDAIKEEADIEKIEEEHNEDVEGKSVLAMSKGTKNQNTAENGRKRKRNSHSQIKESAEPVADENGLGSKTMATVLIKSVGYRQIGSRRKNKPRRAAEAVVECR